MAIPDRRSGSEWLALLLTMLISVVLIYVLLTELWALGSSISSARNVGAERGSELTRA